MTNLLDVNVLVSLAWPSHVHHEASHEWFSEHSGESWATTPITELGFVCVSSSDVLESAVPTSAALDLLHQMCQVPGHVFLADDVRSVVGDGHVDRSLVSSHRRVTDLHLVALARRHGATLVTHDRALVALVGARSRDVALIRPASS